jgi:hypothetical protein
MKTPLTTYTYKASNGVEVKREITERTPGMYQVKSSTNFLTRTSVQPGGIVQMMIDNDMDSLVGLPTCPESNVPVPDPKHDVTYYSTGVETNRENEIVFIVVSNKTGNAATTTYVKKPVQPALIDQ